MEYETVLSLLPADYQAAAVQKIKIPENVTEFRLRCGACQAVTYAGEDGGIRSIPFPGIPMTEDDMREVLTRLCRGSVHAYDASLKRGYFTPIGYPGVRVGVAGRVLCEGGRIRQLQRISSMCIRLPHVLELSDMARSTLRGILSGKETADSQADMSRNGRSMHGTFPQATLFFSPPGVGKTTLLRAVIRLLGDIHTENPLRVCVLDAGEEIGYTGYENLTVDVFSGYPRGGGMAIATRCFAPQVLISDEIGDDEEAEEILRAQGTGVPLIATAHADTLEELLSRPAFSRLHTHGVFSRYVRVRRTGTEFAYTVHEREASRGCIFD